MESPKKIVISGAGLVGSLAAIALKKRGHDVSLYEARDDMRQAGSSAGRSINLVLTRKGIEPLMQLGLLEEVLSITTPVFGRMMHDLKGNLTYQPYGRDKTEKNFSVPRGELNMLLLNIAERSGVKIHFSSGIENIDFKQKRANFKNHCDISYDILLGCDGAGSATRKELQKNVEGRDLTEPLGSGYKELLMPATPDGEYAMDQKALHIWPRGNHFLMALPNQRGSFTMTVYMPDKWMSELTTKAQVTDYFTDYYPDVIELMPNFADDFLSNPHGFLGSLDTYPWIYRDSVALLGDAAHAICPFFGQGMNCGFSDVSFLLQALDNHKDDWGQVLRDYQKYQKPHGDAIREMSLENFKEMSDKVGDDEFLRKKEYERFLEEKIPELYRSRYAQVVYTLTPYNVAYEQGKKNEKVLDNLMQKYEKPADIEMDYAVKLIQDIYSKA